MRPAAAPARAPRPPAASAPPRPALEAEAAAARARWRPTRRRRRPRRPRRSAGSRAPRRRSTSDGPSLAGPTTRLVPSLTTTVTALRAVADDAVLAKPEVAVRDRPARPGRPVDVDPRLWRARQLEAVREPRRRVPEGGRPAIAVEEAPGRLGVLGDDPRGEPGGLLVRDPHAPRRGRRRARPSRSRTRSGSLAHSCPSGRVERLRAATVPRTSSPCARKSSSSAGEHVRRAAVDEREVQAVADAEPVEARLRERERLLPRRPTRGRRGRRRPRRARACARRSRRPAARARPCSGRCRAGSRAGRARASRRGRARPRDRACARARPRPAAARRASSAGRSTSSTSAVDRPQRGAAGAQHGRVQALQQLAGDVERDVRPGLEVRADRSDRDPPLAHDAGRSRASASRSRARAARARPSPRPARQGPRAGHRRDGAGRACPRRQPRGLRGRRRLPATPRAAARARAQPRRPARPQRPRPSVERPPPRRPAPPARSARAPPPFDRV